MVYTHHPGETDGRRGVSLLEVMIYVTVMAILGIPLAMVTVSVSRSSAEGDMLSKILERNRSSLQRIISEYRNSLRGTTAVSNGGKTLQFTTTGGFNGTAPVAGPIIRYEIRLAPGETVNGLDDNRNGLIDESILVRVNPSINEEVVLSSGLNTAGSSFAAAGAGVTINLTTSGHTSGATATTDAQRSITVYPRN
jgi:type II secretory pathway pseudopilin PulG